MSNPEDVIEASEDTTKESSPDNFFIDILTGNKEKVSPKKLLVQKVLRQLIESYGFDRTDIEVGYKHRIKGGKPTQIDISVFQPDSEHTNENLQRVIVCKNQKKRDKLRSFAEAETDLRG
jgi:type I restriction enzyme M protein